MVVKEGSLSLNREGRIIRYGKSLEDILGYTSEDVNDRDFSVLTPKGFESEHADLFDSIRDANFVTGHRTSLLTKDGKTVDIYLSVYPLRDPAGELYSFVLTINTTRAARVPTILTEIFQRFFRFSNDAVAITDRDGNIIDVNQAFLSTYGYTRDEVLGRNPRILKSEHSTRELYKEMWDDILDPAKGYWRGEIINRAKDSREVPVLLSINAVKDSNGEIENFLGIAFDLTEQKEFARTNDMYVDYIVHDIRGPLTSINANAELLGLILGDEASEKVKKKIETIIECADRINTMTSDMLDFSRARTGGLALKKEIFSLERVVKDAIMPFENTGGPGLLVNGSDFDPVQFSGLEFFGDKDKIQRLIYNLLSNAFKHAESRVSLSVDLSHEGLTFSVTDDGKGLDKKDEERVFDAFYQTSEGIKTGGAGLGLSIVKSFVEIHQGRVWVDFESSSGSTFGVFIPNLAPGRAQGG